MAAVKTRKLSDLYRKGKLVTVDDGSGDEPVVVWLQKMNPVENETAIRNANAARARWLMKYKNKDSDEYLSFMSDALDYDKEGLVEYLSVDDLAHKRSAMEAEYAEDNKWNEDDYLQGINDAWEKELKDRYFSQTEDTPDLEANQCWKEIERYGLGFQEIMNAEHEALKSYYMGMEESELRDMLIEKMFKLQADIAWMIEYNKCELWLGVRDPSHHKSRYFENRVDVDSLEIQVTSQLQQAYTELNVGVEEGKDLPPIPDLSTLSELHEVVETEAFSGPEAVNQ